MTKYKVILADPPWAFRVWSKATKSKRSAESHYPTMTIGQLKALGPAIQAESADDCALFTWVTWPLLYEAADVFEAWGFTYKTVAFDWVKVTRRGLPFFGLGYWTRANSEICQLWTRGNPKRVNKGVRQVIWEELVTETLTDPFRGHSVKPDEQYARIESLMGDVPRLELFARRRWPGWDAWGNQVESDISLGSKESL